MNTELKPGMMALVIGSEKCPENIGRIVTIDGVDEDDKSALVCADDLMVCDIETNSYFKNDSCWMYFNQLMPIKPEADPLNTKEEQHASA